MNEQRFEPHLPGKLSDAGATAKDNLLFLESISWRVRTGSPWRDLRPSFGHWNSQFRRFRRWAKSGIFESLFNTMSEDLDLEYALIDGTIVQVHQKATGTKWGGEAQAIGRPHGGLTIARQRMLACVRVDQHCGGGGCARQSGALPAAAGTSA